MRYILCAIICLSIFTNNAVASVYLDGNSTACSDGSTDYNPSSRSCGSGSDTVYTTLSAFEAGIVAGSTNYVRAGDYLRDNNNGTLRIPAAKSGSSNNSRTIIRAYPGEERQAVFATVTRGKTYNSDPADTSGEESSDYYPNTIIEISGASYVTIDGIKTYGQVYSWGGHDVTFQNCDLGGGGPSEYQGNVVKFHSGYNLVLSNSAVHNSCWGENPENGAAVITYDASCKIEYVTFYDNYGPDVFIKDTGGQSGRIIDIGYSHFKPSTINTLRTGGGIRGHNQDEQSSGTYIHNNIFQQVGYWVVATTNSTIRNNTFVNCTISINDDASDGPRFHSSKNNIFYTTSDTQYFASIYDQAWLASIEMDYNLCVGPGKWQKSAPGATTWATTLAGWKTFSGLDAASISDDPSFVNASGINSVDFKRTSYAENFTASPYGTRAGAYVTGNEQIGANWFYGESGEDPEDPDPTPTTTGTVPSFGGRLLSTGGKILVFQ